MQRKLFSPSRFFLHDGVDAFIIVIRPICEYTKEYEGKERN
jgi:hypothetical protein